MFFSTPQKATFDSEPLNVQVAKPLLFELFPCEFFAEQSKDACFSVCAQKQAVFEWL
jgi:hypothetical protein